MVFILTKFATTRQFVLPELNRQPHEENLATSILELGVSSW